MKLTRSQLRKKLLDTGLFVNNTFFNRYLELILNYKIESDDEIHVHHIIPAIYYRHNNVAVEECDNLILVSLSTHLLAHYYLYECTLDYLKDANAGAVRLLIGYQKKHNKITELSKEMYKKVKAISRLSDETMKKIVSDYNNSVRIELIIEKYGISYQLLSKIRKIYSLPLRISFEKYSYNQLYDLYITQNLSVSEISKKLNCSFNHVLYLLSVYDINKLTPAKFDMYHCNVEVFLNYYKNHTLNETAKHFNVSKSTVVNFIRRHDLHKEVLTYDDIITKDDLIDLYINKNMTRDKIAQIFNCNELTIKYLLKKYKIKKPKQIYPSKEIFLNYKNSHSMEEVAKHFNITIRSARLYYTNIRKELKIVDK